MVRHPRSIVALALLLALALPAQTFACTIPIRKIGPLDLARSDLRKPTSRVVDRDAAWGLDRSWVSTTPRLSQFVVARGLGTFHGYSYAKQRAISIDARGPFDNGWLYFSDDDPDTPPCALTGQIEWQRPKIRVVQGKDEVRISASAQRTLGDRTGCILGPDQGKATCPNLTRVVVLLKQPVGSRKLVFETWPYEFGDGRAA